jgi:hypothetical protein
MIVMWETDVLIAVWHALSNVENVIMETLMWMRLCQNASSVPWQFLWSRIRVHAAVYAAVITQLIFSLNHSYVFFFTELIQEAECQVDHKATPSCLRKPRAPASCRHLGMWWRQLRIWIWEARRYDRRKHVCIQQAGTHVVSAFPYQCLRSHVCFVIACYTCKSWLDFFQRAAEWRRPQYKPVLQDLRRHV